MHIYVCICFNQIKIPAVVVVGANCAEKQRKVISRTRKGKDLEKRPVWAIESRNEFNVQELLHRIIVMEVYKYVTRAIKSMLLESELSMKFLPEKYYFYS